MNKICWSFCLIVILFFACGASADTKKTAERGTKDEAIALVKRAVEFFKVNGAGKSFAAFNDTKGAFVDRDLYIIAYDPAGNCLAHGYNNKLVGKNRLDEQDSDGNYYIKDRIDLMKTQNNFWTHYKFSDPLTHKLLPKSLYCEVVDDEALKHVLICSGVYDVQN